MFSLLFNGIGIVLLILIIYWFWWPVNAAHVNDTHDHKCH